jgi:hypothetical protein
VRDHVLIDRFPSLAWTEKDHTPTITLERRVEERKKEEEKSFRKIKRACRA